MPDGTLASNEEYNVKHRLWIIAKWVGITFVAVVFFLFVIVWFNIPRSFPQVDGQIRMRGISGEVEIIRDIDGVPHIYADTTEDLLFAQGFVEAQDRYWQMDFFRHIGNGQLSEMFGASQVDADKFLRTFGWGFTAFREAVTLGPEIEGHLRSYAAGVNAFSGRSSRRRVEFRALRAAGDYSQLFIPPLDSG